MIAGGNQPSLRIGRESHGLRYFGEVILNLNRRPNLNPNIFIDLSIDSNLNLDLDLEGWFDLFQSDVLDAFDNYRSLTLTPTLTLTLTITLTLT